MGKGIPQVKEWNVRFERGDTIVVHAPNKRLAELNTRHGSCRFDPIKSISVNANDADAQYLAAHGATWSKESAAWFCAGFAFEKSKRRDAAARSLRHLPSLIYLSARGAQFKPYGGQGSGFVSQNGNLLGFNIATAAHKLRYADLCCVRDAIVSWDKIGDEVFQCDTVKKFDSWKARERAALREIGERYALAFAPNVRASDVDLIGPDNHNGKLRRQLMEAGVHGCQLDPATRAQRGWGW